MKAYRVKYTIYNYDCWNHYKDFEKKEDADNYAEYLNNESDVGNISVNFVETDKLMNV